MVRLSRRLPPVFALAVAFAAGVALQLLGAPLPPALLLLPALVLPIALWWRPSASAPAARSSSRMALAAAVVAGCLHAGARAGEKARDCRWGLVDGQSLQVEGTARVGGGRGRVLITVDDGLPGGCRATLRVRLPSGVEPPAPGASVRAQGSWLPWTAIAGNDPERAGELRAELVEVVASDPIRSSGDGAATAPLAAPGSRARPWVRARAGALLSKWRAALDARVHRLFPLQGGMVSALVLARRDGLDADVRDDFARTGVAHLLAISGFHVGVVAALVLALLRACLLGRGAAAVGGAACVWAYVLLIGAPDAAVRAAVILTLAATGRMLGRPLLSAGTLSTALLVLLAVDPGGLGRPGFQLSFAGAAGLALITPALDETLDRRRWWPRSFATNGRSALLAGVAATLATLPIVAWHFDRVSLVGIPVTLVATPVVATAIPGILGSLALDALGLPGAAFLAGGVEILLGVLVVVVDLAAGLPFASTWATRGSVVVGAVGGGGALVALSAARGVGIVARGCVVAAGIAAALLLRPVAAVPGAAGTVEIHMLDIGQGDAILLRSPGGRWVLVDTGPGPHPGGGGGRPDGILETLLRRHGVDRVHALVLTHPHLDHIGEAPRVLRSFPVGAVLGPGQVRESGAYADALAAARERGVRWIEVRRGDTFHLDGVEFRVLHPAEDPVADADPNDASIILLLRYGGFRALLTGDASFRFEDGVAAEAGDIDVLKVGHHGSRTSTSDAFLRTVRPEWALVSSGRRNRYGHPHGEVVERLEASGARILRTDRQGTVRVRVDAEGRVEVEGRAGVESR